MHSRSFHQPISQDAGDLMNCQMKLREESAFFLKLGYSPQEVKAALRKLGLGTDTNAVLGELVRSGAKAVPSSVSDGEDGRPASPHRGGSSSREHASLLEDKAKADSDLRPIVIDGSNVAMSHGNKEVFSCRGIELAVNCFLDRGHRKITVFVPSWRKEQPRPNVPISDQHILGELEKNKFLVYTPSRRVGGKRLVCYDDRYIVALAHDLDGIIVSNDTYRDLQSERPEWKRFIEERLLMYSFVNDKFMPPEDPLGRYGPNLDNFLRKKSPLLDHKRQFCPYGKKCTYGIKCKFYHPERTNQSQRALADELRDKARLSGSNEDCRVSGPPKGNRHKKCPQSLEQEMQKKLILDSESSDGKNVMLHNMDEDLSMKKSLTPTVGQSNGVADISVFAAYPSNHSSIFSSDSGLGSYESQFSEPSHSNDVIRSSYPSMSGNPAGSQSYFRHVNSSPNLQPHYSTYNSLPLPNPVHNYSLPVYSGWSYPYYSLQVNSLPEPLPGRSSHRSSNGYSSQPHSAMSQSSAFLEEREEVRQKLYGIFNPHHVNKVMEIFPRLKDAEQLAAETLKLKARGDFF
ncbi:hypothetical protein DNTS_020906 [Danionella cerebrum]|uniref:C3H1-type domain-containing protein n=1 Tax=Danionella cerebrum TaxID=2873325 RepID=A0A553PX14_9TELE|nr:hypothetical protein DNTS_020906 [Danionella translucida]